MAKSNPIRPALSLIALAAVAVGVALVAATYGGQAPHIVDSIRPADAGRTTATTSASTPASAAATNPLAAAGTGAPAAAATPGAPAVAAVTTTAPARQAPAAPGVAAATVTTTAAPVTTTFFAALPATTSYTPSTPWCYDKVGGVWRSGAGESCTAKSPDFVEYR